MLNQARRVGPIRGANRRLALCLVLLAGVLLPLGARAQSPSPAPAAAPAPAWQTFTCPRGGFSIDMPGTPCLTQSSDDSPVGRIREYTYGLTAGGVEYSVEYSDIPGMALFFGGKRHILNEARNGFLKSAGGTAVSYLEFKFEKRYYGKDLVYHVRATGATGRMREILVGHRLYVMVAQPQTSPAPGSLDRFFESFQRLPGK